MPGTIELPFTEMKRWALDTETRGIWPKARRKVTPLSELPDGLLEKIRAGVEGDNKPAYWLDLGLAQIPSRAWFEWHWQRGIDPGARRPAIPPYLRALVIARDGFLCQLCGGDVEPDDVHLDHIQPLSKGGPTTLGNLQVTHSRCNIRKGARV